MRSTRRTHGATTRDSVSALEHYQREKARRARRAPQETEALAAARRDYLALLASDATKGKGGRPRKTAARPKDSERAEEGEAHEE
jgi:hypothetical protein